MSTFVLSVTELVPTAIIAPFEPSQHDDQYVWEEHVNEWQKAATEVQAGLFKLGAIAASLTTRYGERDVQRFAHEVGVSTALIYERASTYKQINTKRVTIHPVLPYTHHKLAAATDRPDYWLNRAEDERWSSRQLDAAIKGEAYTPLEPEPYPLPTPEVSKRLENWKSHVRAQPCLVCGIRGSTEYAHFKALVNVKTGELEGRRHGLSDWLGLPLCGRHHQRNDNSIHQLGEEEFFNRNFGGFDRLMGIYTRTLLEWVARWEGGNEA